MPKRVVYVRDSRGRFARTGTKTYGASRKRDIVRSKSQRGMKPVGKSGLPIVESGVLTGKKAKSLYGELRKSGQNHLAGFLEPGVVTGKSKRYAVVREKNTNKILGLMKGEVGSYSGALFEYSGRGVQDSKGKYVKMHKYSRGAKDFTVNALYREGGIKNPNSKGAGKILMGEAAKFALKAKGDLRVHNAVSGARRFYKSTGATYGFTFDSKGGRKIEQGNNIRSSNPAYPPGKIKRLAGQKVRRVSVSRLR